MLALINKETLNVICANYEMINAEEHLASKLKNIPASKIATWLDVNTKALPTFIQAKQLAKCLKVPFAGLYMNPSDIKMPSKPKITSRRELPDGFRDDISLNMAIIDLVGTRDFFVATNRDLGMSVVSFDISIKEREDPILWAKQIRKMFGIDLEMQFQSNSARKFYLYVREQVEAKGVFIHNFVDVDIRVARGIAIYDKNTPIIGINNADRYPAKTFTIIHELVHIIKRQSSLCNEFFDEFSSQQEEVFCNAVAGEVLVPREALSVKLQTTHQNKPISIADIEKLAKDFSVSKQVIIRRLLDLGGIGKDSYDAYNDEFRLEIEREKENSKREKEIAKSEGRKIPSIPRNIVRETIDKTSGSLCTALFKGFSEEVFSKQDISRYLGIAPKHADNFIAEVSQWNN